MVEKCQGTTQSGKPCNAQARPGRTRCPWHDEELSSQRRAWSERGGKAKSNRARAQKQISGGVMTPLELRGVLGVVLTDVIAGKLEPGVGNAAANIARAMVSIQETQELEERLSALEERAGLAEQRTG
jgi:hypothetical protein